MNYCIAKLELKRVQHYLFSIPRLTIMLGANVRLGEIGRGIWQGNGFVDTIAKSLPELAVECGANFPGGEESQLKMQLKLEEFLSFSDYSCLRNENDPLQTDRPLDIAFATGVLVRDASRLEAVFDSEENARNFIAKATELLATEIPEIAMVSEITTVTGDDGTGLDGPDRTVMSDRKLVAQTPTTEIPFDLPDAFTCQLSAHALAETVINYTTTGEAGEHQVENIPVSSSVRKRREAAVRFNQGNSKDVLGLMYQSIFPEVDFNTEQATTEFKELASENLLAVIHADGNRVGRRVATISEYCESEQITHGTLLEWAIREAMFYRNRQGVRCAIARAIHSLCPDLTVASQLEIANRIRLLMVGGDDILIACDARLAVPLVLELCRKLTEYTGINTENELLKEAYAPLTLGIGIAFVQPSFPFQQAHALAEDLASSAKRLSTSCPDQHVVDWVINKTSMAESVSVGRQRDYLLTRGNDHFTLTQRPYQVLGKENSLEKLWGDAKTIETEHGKSVARSQFRALEASFSQGPSSAVVAAHELPQAMRQLLQVPDMKYLQSSTVLNQLDLMSSVWSELGSADNIPGQQEEGGGEGALPSVKGTKLLDLMEMVELAKLKPNQNT